MEEEIIYKVEVEGIQSIENLTKANKELREERKKLDLQTDSGRARVAEINKELDKNNDIIKQNTSALEKQRLNVGNYKNDIVKAAQETKVFGVSVNDASGKVASFANPVTAIVGLFGALVGAYLSSAAGARDLESAQTSLTSNFKFLSNELAILVGADGKGGGLLTNLADAFNKTFFGIEGLTRGVIARTATNTLKEIEILELDSRAVAKRALDQAETLRRLRDDDNKSFKERIEAAKQVEGFINVREKVLVNTQQQRLTSLKILLAQDSANLNLQKEIKQVQLEIADIQEDSQGKRTEALNGLNALQKQYNQQLADQRSLDKLSQEEANIEELTTQQLHQETKIQLTTSFEQANENVKRSFAAREVENRKKQNAFIVEDERIKESQLESLRNQGLAAAYSIFGKYKTAQIGLSLISTYFSAQKAFESQFLPVATVGSPLRGNIAAGVAIIQGLARTNEIRKAQGFASGGLTGTKIERGMGININRSNGDNMLATVRTGEVILNERQQAALGGARTFQRIGVPGFATGGIVQSASQRSDSISYQLQLYDAISRIQPVVTVQDINTGQNRVSVIENRAQFV